MQYVKIKDVIIEQIDSGVLLPRQKLPSERKLADSFDTTRVTLREALSLLEAEGRIYREDRRGWFISPAPLKHDPNEAWSFVNSALEQKRTPKTDVLSAKRGLANPMATRLLALPPFSEVYQIERVHYLESRPVAYVMHFIRAEYFSDFLDYDFTLSLSERIRSHYQLTPHHTRYQMSITSLLNQHASALRATTGSPAMVIERAQYNKDGEAFMASTEYWRHDAITIESMVSM